MPYELSTSVKLLSSINALSEFKLFKDNSGKLLIILVPLIGQLSQLSNGVVRTLFDVDTELTCLVESS